ncbi:MAG: SLC13 family permease [Rhodospirillales bacterium]|nr:SLC13 family permease [Rhodospirillales bacterium]
MGIEATIQMWMTYALVIGALALYASERLPMEVVSIGVVCALMIFFHLFPVIDATGENLLNGQRLLQGFANPALVTVLALLVMGQAMVRAGVLDVLARIVLRAGRGSLWFSVLLVLLVAMSVSAFLNNIPVVVIFIPIMQGLATRFGRAPSKLMIPLSYAAVLGGMTTLVGSSTNLLVNSAMIELGGEPFGFFDFTIPGLVMAATGLAYLMGVAPRILPARESMADRLLSGPGGRQFIAQLTVLDGSPLVGKGAPGGMFPSLPDITVRMVQREEEAILPPFEAFAARPGDVLVVAATRKALTEALSRKTAQIDPKFATEARAPRPADKARADDGGLPWDGTAQVMAEVMVAPGSRYEGQTLRQIGFFNHTRCVVLGIQRRSRMIRTRMTDIRMEAGDVLLVQGDAADINDLKANREVVLIEWSAEELPTQSSAPLAALIFVAAIGLAAAGLLSLVVATLTGAVAVVATGALNVRQAARAVDTRIVTTIGAALAMGVALQETGGAQFVARQMVDAMHGAGPGVVLSVFFLTVAVLSNLVTTKTAAVLFTPIALDVAYEVGVPPEAFAVAVVFAANCSFASPLGYQTNLLVLGPGHYRFIDFARAGIPLIVIMWLAFSAFAPWWYGL